VTVEMPLGLAEGSRVDAKRAGHAQEGSRWRSLVMALRILPLRFPFARSSTLGASSEQSAHRALPGLEIGSERRRK
jgi:hypothetical protein